LCALYKRYFAVFLLSISYALLVAPLISPFRPCSPGDSTTPVYSFTAPVATGQGKSNGQPMVYGVLADFGITNDISLNELLDEAEAGTFDVVLHSGDLAYDLDNYGGARGNDYMNGDLINIGP
jgi:hypothetical protein